MIDIKDISKGIKLSIEPRKDSVRRFELMKEDYVQAKFSLVDPVYFGIGDNVEIEGEPFYITELMYPSFNTTNGGYDYELRFDSHYFRWKNHILFYDRQGNKEATWSLTRSPEAHLGIVVSNIRSLGFKYKGKDYQAVVDSSVDTVAKLVQYENTNIIDALTKIAEAWECEWWVEGDKIYLGRCEHGEPINLEIGKELSSMSRSQSKETYANRIYAFGSTRNIPSDYRPNTGDGSVVEGVVTKRLMLPVGIDHIDAIEGLKDSEVVDKVVVFDTIYPRTTCTMTSVESKDVPGDTEKGEPETYKVYRFKDSNFHFSSKYILPNQELRIEFQSGPLAGMDFGVAFNPDKVSEDTEAGQVFEIVRSQDYGQWLPADPLIPTVGSQFVLYGFDTKFVSDQLLGNAEKELLEKTQDFVKKLNIDPSTYNCNVSSYEASGYDEQSGVLLPSLAIDMKAGQKVNLINKAYFKNGRVSRVIGFEKKLDIPYDSPTYIVGETSSYSRIGELEEKIDNIQFKGNTYVNQGGGGGVYVIKKEDATAASDENVFSALRTLEEIRKSQIEFNDKYLRKDMNDKGAGFYEWEAGWMTQAPVRSAEYNIGWEVENPTGWYVSETGTAWYTSLNVRGPILSNNVIGSPYYASGWTGYGSQWDMNKHFLETDYGSFRKEIRAKMFVIDQIRGTNGSLAVSDSNKILRVEDKGNVWRCYIDTYGGDVFMNMRVDDAIKCQRVTKYYLALVTNVSSDYFDLSKTNLEGTGVPEAGDEVIRWDNISDPDRKGIVYLTSSDSYAPYMDVRYGDWNATVGTIKVRNGRLDGINDPLFPELYGAVNNFGLYTSNFYGTGELILRSTGESVSRTFEVLKDSIKMGLDEVRYELQVSQGSVLVNPAFQEGLSSWETTNVYYPWVINNNLLQSNYKPFMNFVSGALIVTDEVINRPVMQVADATVIQRNALFTTKTPGKYSLRFSYRSLLPFGSLEIGVPGSQLNIKVNLSDNTTYQKGEVVGEWDGTGDFTIIVNGAVNISDISFIDDKLANAINEVKTYYDTKLTFYAEKAVMDSFREEYDEFNRVVRKDYATQTWTYNAINTEVGTIVDGKLTNYSTTTQTAKMIENKVADLNLGQYATTSWTSNQIRNTVSDLNMGQYATQSWTSSQITSHVKGLASETYVNTTANGLSVRINGTESITEAFYKFTSQSMRLNRRIEMGSGTNDNFTAVSGMSPDTSSAAFWCGSTWGNVLNAKIKLNHDGSGWLASKNIMWDTKGNTQYTGKITSNSSGNRIVIDPTERAILMINNSGKTVAKLGFDNTIGDQSISSLELFMHSVEGRLLNTIRINPGGFYFIGASGLISSLSTSVTVPSMPSIDPKRKGMFWADGTTVKVSQG